MTTVTSETNNLAVYVCPACLRLRQFDRFAQAFLAVHPAGVVVHIGCGLDTRFDRTYSEQADNGQVMWYDLDLPPVIALRRKLLEEAPRYKMIAASALDLAWLHVVDAHPGKPFLFVAEGVLMYFSDAEMRRLDWRCANGFPARNWSLTWPRRWWCGCKTSNWR